MTLDGWSVRPYQRRRARPFVTTVTVLAVVATVTWAAVIFFTTGPSGITTCPAPAAGPAPGEVVSHDVLENVEPAPPSAVRVRVLNAGEQRGLANLVAAQLGDLGFTEAARPDNDPFFPEGNMDCVGQLRFGAAGEAAASTLSLVLPCTELVRDGRPDDSVDVVVGTGFTDVRPARPVRDVLDHLQGGGTDGSENAVEGQAPTPSGPVVPPELLEEARDVTC